ncbi:MAG TPA: hypothetical protein VI997_10230 [Candidatus Thermoplasmatota archaeon]|nr:hypothetical protein [Candidatus Thermoplasmatota archaeon]
MRVPVLTRTERSLPRPRRPWASLLVLLLLVPLPSALAHEDEAGSTAPTDPLHRFRETPWYTVIDDYWVFGAGKKVQPASPPPSSAYRSAWEFDSDGDWLVYVDQTRPGGDVIAYNVEAGAGILLTNDEFQQHNPAIRGTLVAWEDYRDGQAEIYAYDLEKGSAAVRVTNSPASQLRPAVGDGFIVYEDRSSLSTGTDIWIWHSADARNRALVVAQGDQTDAVPAGDHVVFRDQLYDQYDVMAVRIAGGRPPFYLTRDVAIETVPVSSGSMAYFLASRDTSWRLIAFDGIRNRTRDTGYDLDSGARFEVSKGRLTYSAYHNNGRYFLYVFDLNSGRFDRVADSPPLRGGPRWAGDRIVAMLSPVEKKGMEGGLLVFEPSKFALEHAPQIVLKGPPPSAPFTNPRFVANGTFETNPTWGQPLRFEYRLGEGNWTAFDARVGEWNVSVEVPRGYRLGDKVPFDIRAVFPAAPSVYDGATLEYVTLTVSGPLEATAAPSLFDRLKRAIGAIVLSLVVLSLLALFLVRLILRGTLRRWFQRRVDAEYLRPEDPRAANAEAVRGRERRGRS